MAGRTFARRVWDQAMGTGPLSWPYLLVFQTLVVTMVWTGASADGAGRVAMLAVCVLGELWLLRHAVRRVRSELARLSAEIGGSAPRVGVSRGVSYANHRSRRLSGPGRSPCGPRS